MKKCLFPSRKVSNFALGRWGGTPNQTVVLLAALGTV